MGSPVTCQSTVVNRSDDEASAGETSILISLLFTGMFQCLGAGSAFGANAELRNVSAILVGVNASGPAAAGTEEENGPSQKAAGPTRCSVAET